MTFGQPLWFWAFALFPLLVVAFAYNEALRTRLLAKLVAARLQSRLAGTVSVGKRRLRFALLLLGMAAVVMSLAQPRLGYTWEESKRKGRDVLIAIDVSKSMLATDLAPNRLTRAKFAAQDLISQLGGDRVGLIAFAGGAFLQAPLTADFSAVLNSLNELDTEIIPLGGTNLAEAIRVAVEAFGKGESDHRALIIFTDGEELDADGIKAAETQKESVKIFGVGVGSADGSLIPVPGRGGGSDFLKDEGGQFVKSRLDEGRLRKIAETTGGFYVHLQSGPAEMTRIVREGLSKMSEQDIDAKVSRHPIERYQWPLGAGIALLALSMMISERRRGSRSSVNRVAILLAVLGSLGLAGEAAGSSPSSLYEQGKYEDAQQAWQRLSEKNPKSRELAFNLGAAAYKNKDLETALRAFSLALTTDDTKLRAKAEYNLGNTLFQRGSAKKDVKTLQDAVGHYGQSLNLAPEDANARFNKKVTEELIERLKQEEKKPNEDKPKKREASEAAKKAKEKADEAVANRDYLRALQIMQDQLKVDETTEVYSDFIKRLEEINGVQKPDQK
ncbi:MAG: VWA domain-containing protein [Chthoniobacteraceae bacterium]